MLFNDNPGTFYNRKELMKAMVVISVFFVHKLNLFHITDYHLLSEHFVGNQAYRRSKFVFSLKLFKFLFFFYLDFILHLAQGHSKNSKFLAPNWYLSLFTAVNQ